MPDTYLIRINKAYAQLTEKGMLVQIYIPSDVKSEDRRLDQDPEYGLYFYEQLLEGKRTRLADDTHPVRLPSAALMYLTNDGKVVCHRRDQYAPTHKLWFSTSAGFPDADEIAMLENPTLPNVTYLKNTSQREAGEEKFFVTKDCSTVIVPKGYGLKTLSDTTLETIFILELENMERLDIYCSCMRGTDRVEFYTEEGDLLCSQAGFFVPTFDSEVSINLLQIINMGISSNMIYPVDAEGMPGHEGYKRFNRETFMLYPDEFVETGAALNDPESYLAEVKEGVVRVYSHIPSGSEFIGPDMQTVNYPFVFVPDSLLVRGLSALGASNYTDWIKAEMRKLDAVIKGTGLILS